MKRFITTLLIITTISVLGTSCGSTNDANTESNAETEINTTTETETEVEKETETENTGINIVDSTGSEIAFEVAPESVITLGSSLTEVWLLAGGTLVGTTSDSFDREIGLNDGAANVGTYKEPNLEQILQLNPDLVVMSPDISGQRDIEQTLRDANITVMFSTLDSFEDYLVTLNNFTSLNNRQDLYETNGVAVQREIEENISKTSDLETKTGLLLRTSTSMLKALPSDNFAVKILEDMGITNIATNNEAILDDISIEAILKEDPYYIFLVVMGNDEEESMAKINSYISENPAWETLTAVKEGRFIVLPKELFHNKPNNRWGEAYGYIYDIRESQE